MKKLIFLCSVVMGSTLCSFAANANVFPVDKDFPTLLPGKSGAQNRAYRYVDSVYNRIHLASYGLNKEVFFSAFKGYEYLKSKGMLEKENLLTIVDYSQSSKKKRLYVIDLESGRVLFNTYVSHGARSGSEYATSFSNSNESHKSSLGFIVTGSPYSGAAGYSLHLSGLEAGFNDHIYRRSIVLHGSYYVNAERAEESIIGRSFGCPAVPYGQQFDIINTIKDGSCMFIYAPDSRYKSQSRIMNAAFEWPDLKQKSVELTSPALTNTTANYNK